MQTATLLSALLRRAGLVALVSLLRQQHCVNVRQHAALCDRHARQQFVQLVVVPDRQQNVARNDARLLVVARRVARQLEHFGREVLEHCRQIHRRAGADALRVVAATQQPVNAANWELQTRTRAARLGLGTSLPALSATGHSRRLKRNKTNE